MKGVKLSEENKCAGYLPCQELSQAMQKIAVLQIEQVETLRQIKENNVATNERLLSIEKWRHGNGRAGIEVRVDRVEQTLSGLKKLMWVMLGLTGTLIISSSVVLLEWMLR